MSAPSAIDLLMSWRKSPTLPWVVAGALAVLFIWPILGSLGAMGLGDWDQFMTWSVIERRSVVQYHQLPGWNPFLSGGYPLLANPQSRLFSPSFGLVLLFGADLGNRLWVAIALSMGFEGTRRLCRALGVPAGGALFAAVVVAFNGGMALRIAAGHLGDLPYVFLPWFFLGLMRLSRGRLGGLPMAVLTLALCWVEAGVYAIAYGVLLASVALGIEAWRRRSARPVLQLVVVGTLAALIAAPSLVPSLRTLVAIVHRELGPERITLSALGEIFFALDQRDFIHFDGQRWRWHEYGLYVGAPFFLALALGLLRSKAKLRWPLFGAGLFFFFVGLGAHGPLSPWELLHRLPVFSQMRASGRALLVAILCWAPVAGLGVSDLKRPLQALFVIVTLSSTWAVSWPILQAAFVDRGEIPGPSNRPFVQRDHDRHYQQMTQHHFTSMIVDVQQNQGVLRFYDPITWPVHATDRGDAGEVFIGAGRADSVEVVRWSPNAIDVRVRGAAAGSVLVVNQNHDPGWKTRDGRPVIPWKGLLAVRLDAGDPRVELHYRSNLTLLLVLVSLLGIGALFRLARPRGRLACLAADMMAPAASSGDGEAPPKM